MVTFLDERSLKVDREGLWSLLASLRLRGVDFLAEDLCRSLSLSFGLVESRSYDFLRRRGSSSREEGILKGQAEAQKRQVR